MPLKKKTLLLKMSLKQTEKRNGQLRVDTIERICKELGVTLSFFFAEGGNIEA